MKRNQREERARKLEIQLTRPRGMSLHVPSFTGRGACAASPVRRQDLNATDELTSSFHLMTTNQESENAPTG